MTWTMTKKCDTCEHFPNDHHCGGCVWDEGKGENTKWELKKNPIVIERAVLDKIKAEIEDCCPKPKNYAGESKNLAFSLNQVIQIIDKYKNHVLQIIDKYKVETESEGNLEIKMVTNAKEAETYPIAEREEETNAG